jgi:hypothetical protein
MVAVAVTVALSLIIASAVLAIAVGWRLFCRVLAEEAGMTERARPPHESPTRR